MLHIPGPRTVRNLGINDFPDDIITRRSGASGAVPDYGFLVPSREGDAYGYGETMGAARARCAAIMRQTPPDPVEAPHVVSHWARKARIFALGIDPHEARARSASATSLWDMRGGWADVLRARPHTEFLLVLVLAEQARRIAVGETDAETARREAMAAIGDDLDLSCGVRLTESGVMTLNRRLRDLLCDPTTSGG